MRLNQLGKTNKQANNNSSNNKNKTKQKKQKKVIPTLIFSKGFFTSSLPASISKICLLSTIYLLYGMMLFIMSHFFVKTIVFIELVKAILFLSFLLFRFQL